jgi:hypothetical protein
MPALATMFGLQFLFAAGLWALPLAGLPIVLHLLFRQKSPVIQFSTLRFIKLSVQRTATRRRIQKWLLLVCRAMLIALLIWAVAQPAKKAAGGLLGSGRTQVAAIVVDTSYSMQLQDNKTTLLSKANGIVQELLRNEMAGAKVAIFQSQPIGDRPVQLEDASAILAEWATLKPQANPQPLVDRVASAIAFLQQQPADQKLLVVVSDFQSREFGRPIGEFKDGQTILIDLHPAEARSAGVTKISIQPAQPIPGIASQAVVELSGPPGEGRAVYLKTSTVDGASIEQNGPGMANFDSTGRAMVRFPLKLPASRWVVITGVLTADDAMMWDNQRPELLEIPRKQTVTILSQGPLSPAERFAQLALDPEEGKRADWPVIVRSARQLSGREDVAVAVLSNWPDAAEAVALRDLVRNGGNVILFLQPGLEDSWPTVSAGSKAAMSELMPSAPGKGAAELRRVAIAEARDPLLEGITDEKFQWGAIAVRRMVPMTAEGASSVVLSAAAVDPLPGSRPMGFLFRKPIGAGVCYTLATLPESSFTNFATHPTFLPLMVRMALRSPSQSRQLNVELGQPVALTGFPGEKELQIETPGHEQYQVKASETQDGRQFIFSQASEPGIYTWRRASEEEPIALTNLQLPAGESDLTYRPAADLAAGDTIVANGITDLRMKLEKLSQPEPRWSGPIAIVLLLLCLEALMGSGAFSRKTRTPVFEVIPRPGSIAKESGPSAYPFDQLPSGLSLRVEDRAGLRGGV